MTIAGHHDRRGVAVLFGGILLVSRAVDHGTIKWRHGVELEIFMKVEGDATARSTAIKTELDADPQREVATGSSSHDDAYKISSRSSQRPARARRERRRRATCPTSFRVVPTDAKLTTTVADGFKDAPGVDTVTTRREADEGAARRHPHRSAIRSSSMAGVLLASSLFLIVNTIRLGDLRAPPRDRGDEARRRVELVRARAVHGRGPRAGRDRRRASRSGSSTCSSGSSRSC